MLIQQTEKEILVLEGEEKQMRSEIDELHHEEEPLHVSMDALIPLDVPAAPKIARIPRESRIDQKWAAAQRDLVDPMQISRAYLDQTCLPVDKKFQPYWIDTNTIDVESLMANPFESSIESLPSDP